MAWPSPSHCGHLGSKQVDRELSLSLSLWLVKRKKNIKLLPKQNFWKYHSCHLHIHSSSKNCLTLQLWKLSSRALEWLRLKQLLSDRFGVWTQASLFQGQVLDVRENGTAAENKEPKEIGLTTYQRANCFLVSLSHGKFLRRHIASIASSLAKIT